MTEAREPEVLVVGAGPVGLMAALFLHRQGVSVEIIDQDQRVAQHSYALPLHPRTLDLLEEGGLLGRALDRGRRLPALAFCEGSDRRAAIDFARLGLRHPFLLVLRQSLLERETEDELRVRGVRVRWTHRLESLRLDGDRATAEVARLDEMASGYPIARSEWVVVARETRRPAFIIGADGWNSAVRRMAGVETEEAGGTLVFSVYEFEARGDLPDEARVVLEPGAQSVYWPLEAGRCRWGFEITSTVEHQPTLDRLREFLARRAPWFAARPDNLYWSTMVQFDRRVARTFSSGRMFLAGDAAHMSTPVAALSMNAGIEEAHDLAAGIAAVLHRGAPIETLHRQATERCAAWRGHLGLPGAGGGVTAGPAADEWVRRNADRIAASIPATGAALAAALGQVGLGPRA
jgi:2-polyprenyl-6-methoxyphenol hydroxylase-like FAD-dependent oxidoreductase